MPVEEVFRDHVDSFTVMAFSDVSLHSFLTRRHGMLSKQQLKEIVAQLFRAIDCGCHLFTKLVYSGSLTS
jgi:hypothetical protein